MNCFSPFQSTEQYALRNDDDVCEDGCYVFVRNCKFYIKSPEFTFISIRTILYVGSKRVPFAELKVTPFNLKYKMRHMKHVQNSI